MGIAVSRPRRGSVASLQASAAAPITKVGLPVSAKLATALKLGAEKNKHQTDPDPTQHLEKLPEVVSYMHSSNHSSCVIANFYLFCIVCTFAEW